MTFHDVGLSDDGFAPVSESPSDHISCGVVPYNTMNFSVEVLFKALKTSDRNFIYMNGAGGYGEKRSHLEVYTDDKIKFQIDDNTTFKEISSIDAVNYDKWYHVICTRNSNYMKMYINSSLESELEISGYGDLVSDRGMFIFAAKTGGDVVEPGKNIIKKLSLYNRALTAQEVADRYNQSTFLFLNDTPTPTQQNYLDFWDNRKIGRQ
jgi:hypothetical protein